MKSIHKILRGLLAVSLAIVPLCSCASETESAEPVIAEGLPGFTVEGETDLSGNFYLSFPYTRDLIMLDGKGNIIWSKHEDISAASGLGSFWDFKKHEVDGEIYYSYHDETGTYDNYGLMGYSPGERVILDKDFQEIKRITFEASDIVEQGAPLDGHDFLMIDLDHYILSGYIKDTVYNIPGYEDGTKVIFSYLQEVKDGQVVWDFNSTDYPELLYHGQEHGPRRNLNLRSRRNYDIAQFADAYFLAVPDEDYGTGVNGYVNGMDGRGELFYRFFCEITLELVKAENFVLG
jgi:hypothetical protein